MNQNKAQTAKGPEDYENKLSENILDMSKVIIPRGSVLLEVQEIEPLNGLILPDSVDKSSYEYWIVYKLGDDDFAKTHPEFKSESATKVGNVVVSVTPQSTPILTKDGKKYLQVHESSIRTQVTPDNFKIKK